MIQRAARAILSLTAVFALVTRPAMAQTGVVAGVIFDHTNRAGLSGVIVRIDGRDTVVATDFNGRFVIPAVAVGARELEARRHGYATFRLTPVRVGTTDTARVTFSMSLEAPSAVDAGWRTNAATYRGMIGQVFVYRCPPGGPPGTIWGTDVYTDDSSVCTAAVHAGRITVDEGGIVTFEVRPGLAGYAPSTRNGVASSEFAAWQGSFIIR